MTNRFPWAPSSSQLGLVTRTLVNKFSPSLRNTIPLPSWDGPIAEERPEPLLLHGKTLTKDPFQYMEDLFDRKTQEYIKLEQKHSLWYSAKIDRKHQRGRFWAELDSKVVVTSREGGYDKGEERIGDYIYFTRSLSNSSDLAFYRKKFGEVDLLGEELINSQLLKQQFGYDHCTIGICRVTQDGKYLAYTLSVEGGDRFICHVRSVDNASLFHVVKSNNIVNIEFGDKTQFFFTEANELNRPHRVMMQEIRPGVLPPSIEVYRDDDEQFFVDVRKSKDNRFLMITSDAKLNGSVSVLPATYPAIPRSLQSFFEVNPSQNGGRARPIEICGKDAWSWVEHYDGYFIRVTGDAGSNYRLVYCRVEVALKQGKNAEWKELLPVRPDVQIADVDLFEGKLLIYETHFSFERINHMRVIDLTAKGGLEAAVRNNRDNDVVLHFPPLSSITPGLNKNFDQKDISFTYSGIAQPAKDCVFALHNNKLTAEQARVCAPHTLYTQRQSDQFTPWDYMWPYSVYRDVVVGHDGEEIPITIAQRSDAFVQEMTDFEPAPNQPKPCLIYVYGSYGEVPSMHFQLAPYMWMLRRRWTVAFAHVRGGGERPGWAEKGRGVNKINTTLDFISCCEHLVKAGYTTAENMVALGSSAGCVPIGAAMNMRGNTLFGTAIMRSPFLDITNTMIDPDLPLSLVERQDWGDPLNNPEDLQRLLKYDPYHNINDRVTYPSLLISACLDDDRVPGWNALKYVAKLRQQRLRRNADPIKNPIMLRVASQGGHYKWAETEEICDELTFLANLLDLEGPGKVLNDMDMMTHMSNLTSTGAMDHQDAEQVHLRWENWEKERVDYHTKVMSMEMEPNYRKLKADKQPFFWVPTEDELDQKTADEVLKEKSERAGRKAAGFDKQGPTPQAAGRNFYTEEKQAENSGGRTTTTPPPAGSS
jgi:oligopeptidase B